MELVRFFKNCLEADVYRQINYKIVHAIRFKIIRIIILRLITGKDIYYTCVIFRGHIIKYISRS